LDECLAHFLRFLPAKDVSMKYLIIKHKAEWTKMFIFFILCRTLDLSGLIGARSRS